MLLLAFQTKTCEKTLSESASVNLIQIHQSVSKKGQCNHCCCNCHNPEYPGEKQSQPTYGVDFTTELGSHWWKQSVCNTLSPPVDNTINNQMKI